MEKVCRSDELCMHLLIRSLEFSGYVRNVPHVTWRVDPFYGDFNTMQELLNYKQGSSILAHTLFFEEYQTV